MEKCVVMTGNMWLTTHAYTIGGGMGDTDVVCSSLHKAMNNHDLARTFICTATAWQLVIPRDTNQKGHIC